MEKVYAGCQNLNTKLKTNVATYYYNWEKCGDGMATSAQGGLAMTDKEECKKRLGLIAEQAPDEVLANGGRGVDIYKMSAFLLASIKAQQREIEQLSSGAGTIASNSSIPWNVVPESGKLNTYFMGNLNLQGNNIYDVQKISGYLGKWSVDDSGQLTADSVKTKKLEIGSSDKPQGITMYDKLTGQAYCVAIANGDWTKTQGVCGEATTPTPNTPSTSPATVTTNTSASTTPVVDTTVGTSTATSTTP